MKKFVFSVFSCSLLLVSACSGTSNSPFTSLFGDNTAAEYKDQDLPILGSTNFEPIEVSKVGNTGTFVGQKVISFRNELNQLQSSIKNNNAELQKTRREVIDNAIEYHKATAAMEAKLQVGTTPGNPIMYAMLQNAQNNVQVMGEKANTLSGIYNLASSDISVVNNLLDSIRAAYGVSGAVDEDHRQLRILENETSQTAVLINSLVSEVESDSKRQQEYTSTARNYLQTLNDAIKQGSYGIMNAPLASAPVYRSDLQQTEQKFSQNSAANQGVKGKPLFVAKFNNSNVDYKSSLQQAVESARRSNANIRFEVVAVSPSGAKATSAQTYAANIFQDIIEMGVGADKVDLLSQTNPSINAAEVQIFVK